MSVQSDLQDRLFTHNKLMRDALITIVQKRDNFGWNEENCAQLAEETLRKIQ